MICSAERERRTKAEDRCLPQRRREVRKDKGIVKGASRWKGKSWKIGGSRKGAPVKCATLSFGIERGRQRRKEVRKDKGIFKGATRRKGKSWEIGVSRKGAEARRKPKTEGIIMGAARWKGKSLLFWLYL